MRPIKIKIKNPHDWDYAMARGAKGLAKILVNELPPEDVEKLIKKLREK